MRFIWLLLVVLAACPSKPAEQPEPVASASANLVSAAPQIVAPKALVAHGHAVDWWFAFKFNAATYTSCTGTKACPFGGTPKPYPHGQDEQFAFASSESPELAMSTTCIGATDDDPVGATFAQIYNGGAFYVLWNDQFYDDPKIAGCEKMCSAPWAHSKGMVAWGSNGEGIAMQVTTPSWPASGSAAHPRTDGNTLGCIQDDNVLVSQHFFAVRLTHEDLLKVLHAVKNASVVTDPSNPQIVHDGGPADVSAIVQTLGKHDTSTSFTKETLTTGVTLVSKPHALHVPPWQMVSAIFGGVPLRAATWWEDTPTRKPIPSTTASTPIGCWDASLGHAGAVAIATTGTWDGKTIGLKGGMGQDFNHAKLAVTTDASSKMVVFGDMNQEGSLTDHCTASQNGRGGLFYAVSDPKLHASITALLQGATAPAN